MESPTTQDLIQIIAAQNQALQQMGERLQQLEQSSAMKTAELLNKINNYENTLVLLSNFSAKQLAQQQTFMETVLGRLSTLDQQVDRLETAPFSSPSASLPTSTSSSSLLQTETQPAPSTDQPPQQPTPNQEQDLQTMQLEDKRPDVSLSTPLTLPNQQRLTDSLNKLLQQKGYDEKFFPAIFRWIEHLYLNQSQSVHYINQHSALVRTEFKRIEDWLLYLESQVHIIYETLSAITSKGRNIKKVPYISYLKWLELRKVMPSEFATYPTSESVVPESYRQHMTPIQQQVYDISAQLQSFQLYMYQQKVQDAEEQQARQVLEQRERQAKLLEDHPGNPQPYTLRKDTILQLNTSLSELGQAPQAPGAAPNAGTDSSVLQFSGLSHDIFMQLQQQQLQIALNGLPPTTAPTSALSMSMESAMNDEGI